MKSVTIWGVKVPVRHDASPDYLKWMRANLGPKANGGNGRATFGWKEDQARKAGELARDYAKRFNIALPLEGRLSRAVWADKRIRAVQFSEEQTIMIGRQPCQRYVESVSILIPHWDWEPSVTGGQFVPDGREIPADAPAEQHRGAYRDYPFSLAA